MEELKGSEFLGVGVSTSSIPPCPGFRSIPGPRMLLGRDLRLLPPFPHSRNVFHVSSSLCVESVSPTISWLWLCPLPARFHPASAPRGVINVIFLDFVPFCATSVSPWREGFARCLVAPAQSLKMSPKWDFWGITVMVQPPKNHWELCHLLIIPQTMLWY